MADLRKGICVLECSSGHTHGVVELQELKKGGPVRFKVYIQGISEGLHGFHIHRRGNSLHGAEGLCDHYNPSRKSHGDLNDINSHVGDLGNIESVQGISDGVLTTIVETEFIAERVRLRGEKSVMGRSLVVHADRDDLGLGGYDDSKTTGHSGKRILRGVIGANDGGDCLVLPSSI